MYDDDQGEGHVCMMVSCVDIGPLLGKYFISGFGVCSITVARVLVKSDLYIRCTAVFHVICLTFHEPPTETVEGNAVHEVPPE